NEANALALTFGDRQALRQTRQRLADRGRTLAERRAALEAMLRVPDAVLAARTDTALALLAALADKRVPARDLTAEIVRQIRNLKSPALDEQLGKIWGTIRDTSRDAAQAIARYKAT